MAEFFNVLNGIFPSHPRFIVDLGKKAKKVVAPVQLMYKIGEEYAKSTLTLVHSKFTAIASALPASSALETAEIVNKIAITGAEPILVTPTLVTPGLLISLASAVARTVSIASKFAKGFLPLVPPFLYELYNAEELHLQNIKVNITAISKKKIYQVGFGKSDGEGVRIAIEVKAGKPIRFLHNKEAAREMDDFIDPIFPATSQFDVSLDPQKPYTQNVTWKRHEPHTECIIIVEDPGNPHLQDGQIKQLIPLSDHEMIKVIHKDPTLIKDPLERDYSAYDFVEDAETSGYTTLSSVSVNLTEPMAKDEKQRTEIFPLPFDDDPSKANDYYLEVTQFQ